MPTPTKSHSLHILLILVPLILPILLTGATTVRTVRLSVLLLNVRLIGTVLHLRLHGRHVHVLVLHADGVVLVLRPDRCRHLVELHVDELLETRKVESDVGIAQSNLYGAPHHLNWVELWVCYRREDD